MDNAGPTNRHLDVTITNLASKSGQITVTLIVRHKVPRICLWGGCTTQVQRQTTFGHDKIQRCTAVNMIKHLDGGQRLQFYGLLLRER